MRIEKDFLYKFSSWEEVKREVDKLKNSIAVEKNQDLQKEKAIDRLQPIPFLWYEDRDGNRIDIPQEEEDRDGGVVFMQQQMDADNIQHLRMPFLVDSYVDNSGEIFRGQDTINTIEEIVLYLINNRNWNMVDAITIAAITCSRCLNILIEDATGEVFEGKDNKDEWHTHCELCEIIDPEYDRWYKEEWEPSLECSANKVRIANSGLTKTIGGI